MASRLSPRESYTHLEFGVAGRNPPLAPPAAAPLDAPVLPAYAPMPYPYPVGERAGLVLTGPPVAPEPPPL